MGGRSVRSALSILLTLLLAGCAWPDPIYTAGPPAPPLPPAPPVVVVDPPAPVEGRLTHAQVESVRPGMTRAEVVELLGEPVDEFTHPDTTDLVWPAVDSGGTARRLEVRFNAGGAVISRALY